MWQCKCCGVNNSHSQHLSVELKNVCQRISFIITLLLQRNNLEQLYTKTGLFCTVFLLNIFFKSTLLVFLLRLHSCSYLSMKHLGNILIFFFILNVFLPQWTVWDQPHPYHLPHVCSRASHLLLEHPRSGLHWPGQVCMAAADKRSTERKIETATTKEPTMQHQIFIFIFLDIYFDQTLVPSVFSTNL